MKQMIDWLRGQMKKPFGKQNAKEKSTNPFDRTRGAFSSHFDVPVIADGVYYVYNDGSYLPLEALDVPTENFKGVGVVEGKHSLVVLRAVADCDLAREGGSIFKDNDVDASKDWDGIGNTRRMIGERRLSKRLTEELKEGEYIPSYAELMMIRRNQDEIVRAFKNMNLDIKLRRNTWSSTEYSRGGAWLVTSDGLTYGDLKYNGLTALAVAAFDFEL